MKYVKCERKREIKEFFPEVYQMILDKDFVCRACGKRNRYSIGKTGLSVTCICGFQIFFYNLNIFVDNDKIVPDDRNWKPCRDGRWWFHNTKCGVKCFSPKKF